MRRIIFNVPHALHEPVAILRQRPVLLLFFRDMKVKENLAEGAGKLRVEHGIVSFG